MALSRPGSAGTGDRTLRQQDRGKNGSQSGDPYGIVGLLNHPPIDRFVSAVAPARGAVNPNNWICVTAGLIVCCNIYLKNVHLHSPGPYVPGVREFCGDIPHAAGAPAARESSGRT